jgi:carbon monoxide dehydrogenase subunit G
MRYRSVLAGVLLAALSLLPSVGPASRGFSRQELGQLRSGRLVARPIPTSGRRLLGGNSWIVVDAPVAQVWTALSEPTRYPRMWRAVDRVRVLSRHGNRTMVHVEQKSSVSDLEFDVRLDFQPSEREVDFRVARNGGGLREGWGFFKLESQGDTQTLVSYGAAVDPGASLVRSFFEDRLRQRILELPRGVKRYVERRARAARSAGRDG